MDQNEIFYFSQPTTQKPMDKITFNFTFTDSQNFAQES